MSKMTDSKQSTLLLVYRTHSLCLLKYYYNKTLTHTVSVIIIITLI